MKNNYPNIARVGLSLLLYFSVRFSVFACGNPPPDPPSFFITECTMSTIEITFTGYTTFGSSSGETCACGFVLPSIISMVNSVVFVEAGTSTPIAEFSFSTNSTTTAGFNALEPANWSGFSSLVSGTVAANIDIDLIFNVTTTTCVTSEVIDSIMALPSSLGTAGATPVGLPDHHINITPPGSGALPVELMFFEGEIIDNSSVDLSWATAIETNNDYFSIEKSSDGIRFTEIAKIQGSENSVSPQQYSFKDDNPLSAISYYRLKQVNFDGTFDYSEVIAVEYEGSNKNIQIYPNPSNGDIFIQADNPLNKKIKITVSDYSGRKVWESVLSDGEPTWIEEVQINESGTYFTRTQIGDEIFFDRIVIID